MFKEMMSSKIHRATVTQADLNYVGSITIDEDMMDAVGMLRNEKVSIVNNNNGVRFETYTIAGERGSGVVCVNGAAARLVQPGDIVIIIGYTYMTLEEATNYTPKVAIIGEGNRIVEMIGHEPEATIMNY